MQDLHNFFAARHFTDTHSHIRYEPLQWGAQLQIAHGENLDLDDADVVIIGCGECRGNQSEVAYSQAPDAVRKELYQLYSWHPGIRIADMGNLLPGANADDTRASLRLVLHELHLASKIAVVLGGSHDLTMQQYEAFKRSQRVINAVVADALIDLDETEAITDRSFLLDMLTGEPNFVGHYTHLAFQSYFVQPQMLETLDKLRFDFYRVGRLRDELEEAEPSLRAADLFSFDMNAVRFSDAPANAGGSPNGLAGDEACALMRYAGAATNLSSLGIYGYDPKTDVHSMTAKLAAQMLWYFVEGIAMRRQEARLDEDRKEFAEFHVRFTASDATFLKSRRTGRWWMGLPDGAFTPCTLADYQTACNDEMPERWLRAQERYI